MIDPSAMTSDGPHPSLSEQALDLRLRVADPEVVAELLRLPEGPAREAHARKALKIGLIALKHVRGEIDGDMVRREGERILAAVQARLEAHDDALHARMGQVLTDYFDPESGRFAQRVKGLVADDGELADVLRRAVGEEDSQLVKTLKRHFGPESPLMKTLSPSESEGFLHRMTQALQQQLGAQSEGILGEFTLDRKDSALARLVAELQRSHADLTGSLSDRIDEVVKEFSLNEENSALSRLIGRVERAQREISREFSLDEDASALARMRGEMLRVLGEHEERNVRFREAVLAQLSRMQGAREEEARSTRHGLTFEQAVYERVQALAQGAGDVATFTGNSTGLIRNNKKGDVVLTLGPDAAGAGRNVVLEAKEEAGYGLDKALAELAEARKNRAADTGVFVFSKRIAPQGMRELQRFGSDVVLVWDAEDTRSDVYLDAGVTVAKALCTRGARERDAREVDLTELDRAVLEVEKQSGGLGDVSTWATTIQSSSEKIIRKVATARKAFERQVRALRELLHDLRQAE